MIFSISVDHIYYIMHATVEVKEKEKKAKTEALNLNLLGRISLSKPHLIVGHILLWYKIPVIIGIVSSLTFGFYFETYVRFIDYLELNPLLRIMAFMIGLTPMALIVSFVAFLRTFDEEIDNLRAPS